MINTRIVTPPANVNQAACFSKNSQHLFPSFIFDTRYAIVGKVDLGENCPQQECLFAEIMFSLDFIKCPPFCSVRSMGSNTNISVSFTIQASHLLISYPKYGEYNI